MRNSSSISDTLRSRFRKTWRILACIACFVFLSNSTLAQTPDTLWSEDWELGIGSWFASNGVWQVGVPTTNPPSSAHSGQNCAGTN